MQGTKRLFLGNLPPDVTEKDVRHKFSSFGSISSVEIKSKKLLADASNNNGHESSTFAFVELALPSDAQLAECNNACLSML